MMVIYASTPIAKSIFYRKLHVPYKSRNLPYYPLNSHACLCETTSQSLAMVFCASQLHILQLQLVNPNALNYLLPLKMVLWPIFIPKQHFSVCACIHCPIQYFLTNMYSPQCKYLGTIRQFNYQIVTSISCTMLCFFFCFNKILLLILLANILILCNIYLHLVHIKYVKYLVMPMQVASASHSSYNCFMTIFVCTSMMKHTKWCIQYIHPNKYIISTINIL